MPTISLENLRFGSTRYTDNNKPDPKALPSLYFISDTGEFTRVRPYHKDGFAVITSSKRNIYVLGSVQHDTLKNITDKDKSVKFQKRVTYLTTECKNDLCAPGADVSGKEGCRIVDYSPSGSTVHRGHHLLTVATVEKVYEQHGIDLRKFVSYMASDNNAFADTEMDVVIEVIKSTIK